jgi:hypothetical protein
MIVRADNLPAAGQPLLARLTHPTGESANDEASSRIHSRSPVRPSPVCDPRMGHAGAGTVPARWTGTTSSNCQQS